MGIFADIDNAFATQLNTMVGAPPIAWENNPYTPTSGTLFVRPTNLAGATEQASLGDSGEDVTDGIYQIDIFGPSGEGKYEALAMADTIADRFKRGTDLTYNTTTVRIRNVSRGAAVNNADGWFQVPVILSYVSYTDARA